MREISPFLSPLLAADKPEPREIAQLQMLGSRKTGAKARKK